MKLVYAALLCSIVMLPACTHTQKMDSGAAENPALTLESLLVKLKAAYDEGLLGKESFYSDQLGVRLERPISIPPRRQFKEEFQTISFARTELQNSEVLLITQRSIGDRPSVALFITLAQLSPPKPCVPLANLQRIWGINNYKLPYTLLVPHWDPDEPYMKRYKVIGNGTERYATFGISDKPPFCIGTIRMVQVYQ